MSLEDRFTPNDGSLIDRVDCKLIDVHDSLASSVYNITGLKEKDFSRGLYIAGGISSVLAGIAAPNPLSPVVAGVSIAIGIDGKSTEEKTRLDDEISSEAVGLHRKFDKYLSVSGLVGGVSAIAASFFSPELPIDFSHSFSFSDLLFFQGIHMSLHTTAKYVMLGQANPPPGKKKRKPVLSSLKEKLKGVMSAPKYALHPSHATLSYSIKKQ